MKTFKTLSLISTAAAMTVGVSVALADPPAAPANSPAPVKMDAATLGRLDALFTVCAKADAKNRTTYEKYRTEMIVFGEGTPYEMRAPGSDAPEYKRAHDEVIEAVGKSRTEALVADCGRMIGVDLTKKKD